MSITGNEGQEARDLARQAQEVAGRLKPGTWESVQALALLSIAKSLSSMTPTSGPDRR